MKRKQIVKYRSQLERLLKLLRLIIGFAIVLTISLFFFAIYLYFENMLLGSVLAATVGFATFRLVQIYAISITKKIMKGEEGQEEMFHFLDKEMKNKSPREFFNLLEQALRIIDNN